MVMVTPNFNLNGRCEEAIETYKKAFHAQVLCMLRYSQADPADYSRTLTKVQEQYIYHAELMIGNQRIMMCDNMEVPFQTGLSLSLTVTFDTKEEVLESYEVLKEGSTIIYPVHSTTYSSCEVVLIDKFGFRWGLMTEQIER